MFYLNASKTLIKTGKTRKAIYIKRNIGYQSHKAHEPCYFVICDLSGSTFSTICHKWHFFFWGGGGGIIDHKMCVLIFSLILSEIFLILRRIQPDIINVHIPSNEVCIILVRLQ